MLEPQMAFAGEGASARDQCGPPWLARLLMGGHPGHSHGHGGERGARGGRGQGRGGFPGGFPFGGFPGGFPGGGPGSGPGGGPPFGRPPFGGWRGSKARRGDVRTAVLSVLADQPLNGYQVIQEIAERTDGAWKPSPGSVYPTLQQLEDEGLVRAVETDGRRLFHLTAAGTTYVEDHADELAATWDTVTDDTGGPPAEMIGAIGQVMGAVWQVTHNGTDAQRAQAREILERTRRDLYQLLADGDPTVTDDATTDRASAPRSDDGM